eukprot:TRINITY_DN79554_c0_g1_i1.p1 TRINITY_DN79554_c0_g1~~TRINITY_DN79554_c0_g1_i1.p1  ORF type:complete len:122 (-),score=18.97 TRINITY_DN79554_c0_g1_i1:89-454(-)
MTRLSTLLLAALACLRNASATMSCVLGEPGLACVESTSILGAAKVVVLCQIKMYPMQLHIGDCEHKGFTCPKELPSDNRWASGMREFELPHNGTCHHSSSGVNMTALTMLFGGEHDTALVI